jgi:hypothetical protein
MKKGILLVAIATSVSIFMPLGKVYADDQASSDDHASALACYAWSIFPNERFKLDVKKHSPLSVPLEERTFRHARQTAFSVHGKQVGTCGAGTIATIDGTVITAVPASGVPFPIATGAHMDLETHVARAGDSCRNIIVDCTTTATTPVPATWSCFSRNEFGGFQGASTLTLVDETRDQLCSTFQDPPEAVAAPSGPASGLEQ